MTTTIDIDYLKEITWNPVMKPNGQYKGSVMVAFKKLRVLSRDNFQCVKCKTGDNLTIHHKLGVKGSNDRHRKKYPLRECETMCISCHDAWHEKYEIYWDTDKFKYLSREKIL